MQDIQLFLIVIVSLVSTYICFMPYNLGYKDKTKLLEVLTLFWGMNILLHPSITNDDREKSAEQKSASPICPASSNLLSTCARIITQQANYLPRLIFNPSSPPAPDIG
jgi:hypothetical protein